MVFADTGLDAYTSLGDDINKFKHDREEAMQGVVSEKLPELKLEMPNEDIISLTTKWEKSWLESTVKSEWEQQWRDNEKYWLGKQFDTPKADKNRPMVDNLIFEALETFLPQATRRNPEPLVTLDTTEKGEENVENPIHQKYVLKVKNRLGDIADKLKLRLKLKKGTRFWAIYLIGVAKFGWDLDKDIPSTKMIRPQRIILDPDATIDEDGYSGGYIGEYRKMEASKLLKLIDTDEGKSKINEIVNDKKATQIKFIEWWTPEYMCWTLDKTVLLKRRNPHWNYDISENDVSVDDYGNETPTEREIKGINHLPSPHMPYAFLTIFNLGDRPVDRTSLIGQNLSNQDLINKRNRQIDKNADSMNGGLVVSLGRSGLTEDQAKNVTSALRKGGTVLIPDGTPRDAIDRYPAIGLPDDVYDQLNDSRIRLRDIFGIRGSSAAGLETEKTVRGKFQNRALDTDRIGGGITEYLEQWADDIYNWWVQLLYVYDSGFQFIEGAEPPKVVISVKEGSLLPKDSLTIANQAIELASAGKMSLKDLYTRLEDPNAEETAANAWLEINAPELLYPNEPRIAQVMQMRAAQAQAEVAGAEKPPNINYDDLPPKGKQQMASKAGINISEDEIVADERRKELIKSISKGPSKSKEKTKE